MDIETSVDGRSMKNRVKKDELTLLLFHGYISSTLVFLALFVPDVGKFESKDTKWTSWQWHDFVAFSQQIPSSSTPVPLHISSQMSPLNRLKWQKASSPHQLCLSRYFLPSILCNICSHFQHFKVMSKAEISFLIFCLRYLSPHFGSCHGDRALRVGPNCKNCQINI